MSTRGGRLNLERHLAPRQQEAFFLSVVTASELFHGVHRAGQPQVRAKRFAFVEVLLERFPLVPRVDGMQPVTQALAKRLPGALHVARRLQLTSQIEGEFSRNADQPWSGRLPGLTASLDGSMASVR